MGHFHQPRLFGRFLLFHTFGFRALSSLPQQMDRPLLWRLHRCAACTSLPCLCCRTAHSGAILFSPCAPSRGALRCALGAVVDGAPFRLPGCLEFSCLDIVRGVVLLSDLSRTLVGPGKDPTEAACHRNIVDSDFGAGCPTSSDRGAAHMVQPAYTTSSASAA